MWRPLYHHYLYRKWSYTLCLLLYNHHYHHIYIIRSDLCNMFSLSLTQIYQIKIIKWNYTHTARDINFFFAKKRCKEKEIEKLRDAINKPIIKYINKLGAKFLLLFNSFKHYKLCKEYSLNVYAYVLFFLSI